MSELLSHDLLMIYAASHIAFESAGKSYVIGLTVSLPQTKDIGMGTGISEGVMLFH